MKPKDLVQRVEIVFVPVMAIYLYVCMYVCVSMFEFVAWSFQVWGLVGTMLYAGYEQISACNTLENLSVLNLDREIYLV